jgi:hypothetical protein
MPIAPPQGFDVVRQPLARVERGSVVRLGGRVHVVLGFEPAAPGTAYLQDGVTGAYRSATLAELAAPSAPATTAAAA